MAFIGLKSYQSATSHDDDSGATLNPGESLILGGFKGSDGNYEFTRLEVEPVSGGDSSTNYQISPIEAGEPIRIRTRIERPGDN